jgi:biotin synthase-like enzyme
MGSYVTPHNGHSVFSDVRDVSELSRSNQVCEAGELNDTEVFNSITPISVMVIQETELHTCINTGKITGLNNIQQWVKLIKSGN